MSSDYGQQIRVFQRYCRRYALSLTPELAVRLAARYAQKHARELPVTARRAEPRAAPDGYTSAMSGGHEHQIRVFQRYCRRYRLPLTPELAVRLAARYAEKPAESARRQGSARVGADPPGYAVGAALSRGRWATTGRTAARACRKPRDAAPFEADQRPVTPAEGTRASAR